MAIKLSRVCALSRRCSSEDRILLVGATNRPQELDEAARRRMVKRLYIPLPDAKARGQLVRRLMSTQAHSLSEEVLGLFSCCKAHAWAIDLKSLQM